MQSAIGKHWIAKQQHSPAVVQSASVEQRSMGTTMLLPAEKLPPLNEPALASLDDDCWAALLLLASDELVMGAPPLAALAPPSELLAPPSELLAPPSELLAPPLPSLPSPSELSVPVAQLTTSTIPHSSPVGANQFVEYAMAQANPLLRVARSSAHGAKGGVNASFGKHRDVAATFIGGALRVHRALVWEHATSRRSREAAGTERPCSRGVGR